jgi:hypothetical protein
VNLYPHSTPYPHLFDPPGRKPSGSPLGYLIGLVAVVVLVGLALFAQAGESIATDRQPEGRSTVRIKQQVCFPTTCQVGYWSGTLIGGLPDQRFCLLTCAHGYNPRDVVLIEAKPGEWTEGRFIGIDKEIDLGLVAFAYDGRLNCEALAESPPALGDALRTRGYPRGNQFRDQPTRLLTDHSGIWELEAPFIQGESGGAVVGPNGLVGVIVGTDLPLPFKRDRNGFAVGWHTVSHFVETTLKTKPRVDRETEGAPESEPFRRTRPSPAAGAATPDLGEPGPVGTPADIPADAPAAPQFGGPSGQPTEPDWSLARLVVLVPRQKALDAADSVVRAVQKLSGEESGPGKTVRRWIAEKTDGKAAVDIVYERLEPQRYAAIASAAGVKVGGYAGVVCLVKRQDSGILSPLKTLALSIAERVANGRLPEVPFEFVFERTAKGDFDQVEDALAMKEPASGEGDQPQSTVEWVLAAVYAAIRGVRQAIQHYRGAT